MTPSRFAVLTVAGLLAAAVLPGAAPAQQNGGNPSPRPSNPSSTPINPLAEPAVPGVPHEPGMPGQGGYPMPGPGFGGGVGISPYGGANPYGGATGYGMNRGALPPAGQQTAPGAGYFPGYGPAYGPGYMPGGSSSSQGQGQGGAGSFYGGATANPYLSLYGGAARITSRPQGPAWNEDTARVMRLARYANKWGGLDWPAALLALPPGPQATRIRQQIDMLLAEAMRDTSEGNQVKPGVLQDLREGVKELRRMWAAHGELLPLSRDAIDAGQDFLGRLNKALE